MMTPSLDGASEVAQAVSSLVEDARVLPEQAAAELARLLGDSLASQGPAARRQARLGLLIELVGRQEREGHVTTTDYEKERRSRLGRGEDWPDASQLSRAYGHWLSAVRAAARFWFDGGAARVPSSYEHAGTNRRSYVPRQIVSALIAFRQEHGAWPTEWEWEQYATLRRQTARRAGSSAEIPSLPAIRKAFDDFGKALEMAESHFGR